MEHFCPKCMGTLVQVAEQTKCTICGTTFEVLFDRQAQTMQDSSVSQTVDQQSPASSGQLTQLSWPPESSVRSTVPAPSAPEDLYTDCPKCGQRLSLTPDLLGGQVQCVCKHVFPVGMTGGGISGSRDSWGYSGILSAFCHNHPKVQATVYCRKCKVAICSTCDFVFPGNLHLCPACATTPQIGLSPKRKGRVYWTIVLNVWSTVGTVVFLVACQMGAVTTAEEAQIAGMAAWLLAGVPALIALGLGISCFDRRLGNPPLVWVVGIWGMVITGFWLLLIIMGMVSG